MVAINSISTMKTWKQLWLFTKLLFVVCAREFIYNFQKNSKTKKNVTLNEFTQSEKYLRLQCTVLLFVIWWVIKGFSSTHSKAKSKAVVSFNSSKMSEKIYKHCIRSKNVNIYKKYAVRSMMMVVYFIVANSTLIDGDDTFFLFFSTLNAFGCVKITTVVWNENVNDFEA